jgi:hypothetical protein
MAVGSMDPKNGGPGRGTAWVVIVVLVTGVVLQSFSAAQFVFEEPLVLAVGCLFAAVALLWVCFLGIGELWKTAVRGGVTATAAVLAVIGAVLGYGALDLGRERIGPRIAATFDVPWNPGVFDPKSNMLVTADGGGVLRGFDLETNLQAGRAQRIGHSIGDLEHWRGFVYATVDEGVLTRVLFGPARRRTIRVRYGSENGQIVIGAGSIWVNDRAAGRILRYSFDLDLIAEIPLGGRKGAEATSLTFGGPGLLWVTDSGRNALYRIDPEKNDVVVSKSVLHNPTTLGIDGGVVYVAHPGIRALIKHDAFTGNQLPGRTPIGAGPTTVDASGKRLFICNVRGDRVLRFSLATGKRRGTALPTGLSPTDLIVAPEGKMWAMNRGGGSITPIEIGG